MEIWEWIPKCEGRFMASNYGRMKSFVNDEQGSITEFRINNHGYRARAIRINGKPKTHKVHRMVALLFIENHNPEIYNMVNHIDGDKLNNHHTNLEWTNSLGNVRHAIETGLRKSSPLEKLTKEDVRGIRKEFNDTLTHQNEIGVKYDITAQHVISCVTFQSWARLDEDLKNTYKINYLEGDELTEWLENKQKIIIPKIPIVIINYNKLSKEDINTILNEYVCGTDINDIKTKWSINRNLLSHIIDSNGLPHIKLFEGEEVKRYSDKYLVTNIGRVINNGVLATSAVLRKNGKSKGIIRIVAELFIPNPNNYTILKTLDGSNLNQITKIDISNLGWFDQFNEVENPQLIIDEYNTTELTKSELRVKYNLTFEQSFKLLKGLRKKGKGRKPYVSQKKPVVHICKRCSTTNLEDFNKSSTKTCVKCTNIISKERYGNLSMEDKTIISKKNKEKYKNLSEEQLLINKAYQKNYRDKNRKSND